MYSDSSSKSEILNKQFQSMFTKKSTTATPADDCLLYREIKNNQDQIDMQRDLDALIDWGSTWGMKFNAKKCNIMRVSRSRKPLQHFYSLG